jgi:sulfate/thiosulfate transport system ATP-binding protein
MRIAILPTRPVAVVLWLAGAVLGRMGDALLRPLDVQMKPDFDATGTEALVTRIVRLGAEVRVGLVLQDGRGIWTQLARENAQQLELSEGQILSVRLPAARRLAS